MDKKPDLRGDWKARSGDNFYSQDNEGNWKQHRNRFHLGQEYLEKDTKKPHVFVGRSFWYFGENAQVIPDRFTKLRGGRGIRVNHDPELVKEFLTWATSNWEKGIHGIPNDNPRHSRFINS